MTERKVVLVTGAGQRVGRAIAERFGRAHAAVAVHYHTSREAADEVCRMIEAAGGKARAFQADLYKAAEARRLVDDVVNDFGGLDTVVASAANFDRVEFDQMADKEFEAAWGRALDLNLMAPFWLARRAAPVLRARQGSVVVITCSSATRPYRNYLPYTVSKAAVRHLVRTLALELAPYVRVNAVAPGTVLPPEDMPAEVLQKVLRRVPLGRAGSPDDIAEAVYFVANAPYVTGQEIGVDGGVTI